MVHIIKLLGTIKIITEFISLIKLVLRIHIGIP